MPAADQTPCPTDRTDEELILEYRVSRDQSLFSILVHRYERELYSYLRRYLGRADWAEDAFQAAFLQLHLKCDQFQEGRRLKPWLYMIATNKAIDLQRKQKRHQIVSLDTSGRNADGDAARLVDLVEGDEPSPLTQLNRAETGDWVQTAIDKLPEHLRLVVNLVYYQGLKYREAADVLSIPVGTVKSRLHSAIGKLTEEWDETHEYRE
jgi:RNA polymerase sigma-70 factor (ECF subfamily)